MISCKPLYIFLYMGGSRGGGGERGSHSNTGPGPLKKHKATKPAFNVGPSSARQRNAI